MSEICFVNIGNIYTMPFLKVYTNDLKKPYDIIYWNRDLIEEESCANTAYSFNFPIDSKKDKIIGYVKYANFCRKIFKKNNYKKVVFLGTISCIVNFFNLRSYGFDYIVDVRDYTLERNWLFYNIENICFKHAREIVISSPAYRDFLPKNYDYLEIHNIQKINYQIEKKKYKLPIQISFIGTIIYVEENIKFINTFANDERFVLNFIGKNSEVLKAYCQRNKINNVVCKGRFNPDEIIEYYKECDVILNAYGNDTPHLDYALSNKLYFSIFMKLPIIVNENTYMERVSTNLGLGIVYKYDSSIKDKILNFSINDASIKKIDEYAKHIVDVNSKSEGKIQAFFDY